MITKRDVVQGFRDEFGTDPVAVTRAPGRLEILGNHTDYNEGVVLSVAVDRATFVAVGPSRDDVCRIRDLRDQSLAEFRLCELGNPRPGEWVNYIKGVLVELEKRGARVPAFQAVFRSDVPLSAGMSSSAALEMSFAYAFGVLANVDLGPVEWARVGQGAENHYVGARTGLLDQFSSIMGREDHLVYSDFRTLEVTRVPLPAGVALVVANTKVKHTLTHEYNERREACERAVAFLQQRAPGVRALRDVSRAELEAAGEAGLDPVVLRRARHVVTENERVFAGVQDLSQGRIRDFGGRMFTSHDSSRLDFENSCAELDVLVETARGLSDCYGARLSGGGFGGITVHLVRQDEASAYGRALADAYEARLGGRPEVMVCRAAAGAAVL